MIASAPICPKRAIIGLIKELADPSGATDAYRAATMTKAPDRA